MRNVSGYLTDDGKFFQDKKEAEAHERMANMTKRIQAFVNTYYNSDSKTVDVLSHWESYKLENQDKTLRA